MAELKFSFWVLQATGYTAFIWSFFLSVNDVKSVILFLVGLTFGLIKLYSAILDVQKKRFDWNDYKRLKKKERDLDNLKVQQELKNAG